LNNLAGVHGLLKKSDLTGGPILGLIYWCFRHHQEQQLKFGRTTFKCYWWLLAKRLVPIWHKSCFKHGLPQFLHIKKLP